MDVKLAVEQLAALAQETRLNAFRLLLERGQEGVPATEIAETLGVRQNLMSSHLGALARSGLTTTRRDGRRVYHAIDFEATRDLLVYLISECCAGDPAKCVPMVQDVLAASGRVLDEESRRTIRKKLSA
ncbi:MAG: metalloregulator ArsR/SmtB family transcription factor [Pseudomonadota bacterium]